MICEWGAIGDSQRRARTLSCGYLNWKWLAPMEEGEVEGEEEVVVVVVVKVPPKVAQEVGKRWTQFPSQRVARIPQPFLQRSRGGEWCSDEFLDDGLRRFLLATRGLCHSFFFSPCVCVCGVLSSRNNDTVQW